METANLDIVRFKKLSEEIHEWSVANFGNQSHLLPLLGIGEEIGEFRTAHGAEEIQDALGDIGIYFADFCANVGLWPTAQDTEQRPSLVAANGELCHCCLKAAQGIRGFDAYPYYVERLQAAINWFYVSYCDRASYATGKEAVDIMEEVWEAIVKKRNWKKGEANV